MARTKPDFSKLPDWGKNAAGRFSKLAPTSLALDSDQLAAVDSARMSATAIISTPTPDRMRDSVIPAGCQLVNYKKNPVVLWEHGLQYSVPIARSEDDDGNLSVAIGEASVVATSYFTNRTKESEQIFALIDEKIIRGTSIRLTPIKSSIEMQGEDRIYLIDEWDLEEWSWVGVGMNPEAVAGVVAKNRLADSPIAEPILKSLKLWLPERIVKGRGWRETEGQDVAKSKPKAGDSKEPDEDDKPKSDPPADDKPDDKPADDADANKPKAESPYGQQLASAAYATASDLASQVEKGMGPLEHPEMKAAMGEFQASLAASISILEGAYSSCYPDGDPLKKADDVQQDDEDTMKSFLASGSGPRLQLKGLGQRLKQLSKSKSLTRDERKSLVDTIDQMERMAARAVAAKSAVAPTATTEPSADLQKQIDDLAAQNESIAKKLSDIMPHRAIA